MMARPWRLALGVRVVSVICWLGLGFGLGLGLAGCVPPELRGEKVVVAPSYVFTIGVHRNDVLAMLGEPEPGTHLDRLTQTEEVVYAYPFPAIQAETQFANGITRSEMVDRIHLYFDRNHVLVRMASRTNRWYSAVIEQPVQRITVLPRLVHRDGRITAPPASSDSQ